MSRGPADPARLAALDLLRAVEERAAYANLTLPGLLRERGLAGRDAAFATELGYGALRAEGTLDLVLARCSSRPVAALDPPVRALLRLGAYQLLRMRVPAHAAVSETVDLAGRVSPRAAGYVNAVLRRVAERDGDGWLALLAPPYDADPVGHLAVRYAHPRWVVAAFRDALGGSLPETRALLAADDAPGGVHLAARPGRVGRPALLAELAAAGATGQPGPFSPYAVHLDRGDPGRLAAVRDGRAGVMDEGSQLVALALARGPVTGPDRTWLDLTAGPGGKAALLAGLAAERGARLLAVDRAPHRAGLVAGALGGTGPPPTGPVPIGPVPIGPVPTGTAAVGTAAVAVADGTVPGWVDAGFDRVLLDAPCTGLGALRRRPEVRWRRQPADVARLAALQSRLLRAAVTALRPGGLLCYAVCSPHLAETAGPVADAVRRGDVEPVDARAVLPGVPDLGPGPAVQLWPHRHGTDAMHLALLRRTR